MVCNKAWKEEFLENYCGLDGNDDGWCRDIACYGRAGNREAMKGSPVVPGSAALVYESDTQVMYTITVLRGHTVQGSFDEDTSVFQPGSYVDYVPAISTAFREKKCTVRRYKAPVQTGATDGSDTNTTTEAVEQSAHAGLDARIAKLQTEVDQSQSTILRWSAAHFGDTFSAFLHLKVVHVFVESVLRYGVPADFGSFFAVPSPGRVEEARAALCDAVLKARPRLHEQHVDDGDGEDGDEDGGEGNGSENGRNLPFVCHFFKVTTGTASA